jgi:hypothetical protein
MRTVIASSWKRGRVSTEEEEVALALSTGDGRMYVAPRRPNRKCYVSDTYIHVHHWNEGSLAKRITYMYLSELLIP